MHNLTSKDCWHCSLVSYQVSYLTAENMHHFAGYILPGLVFSLLGLRWTLQLIWEWTRQMMLAHFESSGLPATPAKQRSSFFCSCTNSAFSLPWEGIIKLILTGLGIVVSVIASSPQQDSEYVSNIRYATIYLFFALSGLMDILVYYCGYSMLPEGIQSFILSLAFVVEGIMFSMRLRFEGYLEQQIHALLVIAVFSCALACVFEVLYDNRLVKFSRAYLCLLQGTWLIHAGFIMMGNSGTSAAQTYPDSLEWVSILFMWHVASDFVLFILGLLVSCHFSKRNGGLSCLELGLVTPSNPANPNQISGSTTPRSASFHSPTTVQTNISPTGFDPTKTSNTGMVPTFSYIQSKQLPTPPPESAAPYKPHPQKGGGYLHQNTTRYPYPLPTIEQEFSRETEHAEEVSRAAVAVARQLQEHRGSPMHKSEEMTGNVAVSTPVIVEAMPRDSVMLSEDYRTLTREDELRASIKLKESSLI